LATADKWKEFDKEWSNLLRRSGIQYSHAHTMLQRKPPFRDLTQSDLNHFFLQIEKVINKYLGVGFVAMLKAADYNKFYKDGKRPKKLPLDTQYGVLFRATVSFLLGVLEYEYKDKAEETTVGFVLEDGAAQKGDAQRLYDCFKCDKHVHPVTRNMLAPKLDFADKKSSPGCQAADLMLHAAYKQAVDEHGREDSPPIEDTIYSANARPREEEVPVFRIPLGRDVLESLNQNLFLREDERRKHAEICLEQSRLRRI
jgi:hypothetical protein